MARQEYATRHLRTIYDGFLKLHHYEAKIRRGNHAVEVVREVHDHGHGAAVLPYDAARRTALLVRQLRVPVHLVSGDGLILEAAAGLIDPEDDSPLAAARREAREELGYDVHDLAHVSTFYSIPGLVTEQMHCYLARYTPADKVEGDTGADADEVLDVEEWPLKALWESYQRGELQDIKAIVCLMALRLEQPDLFA
ncbi:MAG: NUDIX domain-containing protein [Acuticoccus sp.]